MKQLYIMRHASPAQHGPDGTDFSRPLISKGFLEAQSQAQALLTQNYVVDKVVSSSAVRARQTAESLVATLLQGGQAPQLEVSHQLYNAGIVELLDALNAQPLEVNTLILVAHMPGVAELVQILLDNPAPINLMFTPATMVGVEFASENWEAITPGMGRFTAHAPPP